ncbi:MAG: hypothetical protein ACOX8U_09055 [Bradymonadia bacterium]
MVKTCSGGVNCELNAFRYASECRSELLDGTSSSYHCAYRCAPDLALCTNKCLVLNKLECHQCPNTCQDGDICEIGDGGRVENVSRTVVCSSPE